MSQQNKVEEQYFDILRQGLYSRCLHCEPPGGTPRPVRDSSNPLLALSTFYERSKSELEELIMI